MSEPRVSADRAHEGVERVDTAAVAALRDVDVADVYRHMDWLLERRPTPMDLYHRWERQNWSTQDLDLAEDAEQWAQLGADLLAGLRSELQHTMTLFFIGEQAVTDTLAPLVHAAPDEPSRIFLATQLVDEARHTVFFSRFFGEVVGIGGGLAEALSVLRDDVVAGFTTVFDGDLVATTEAVRRDPSDAGVWVEAITIYHLIVEGMLALTGQKYLLQTLRSLNVLPGFYAGFTAVARDESRHVNFGVRALADAGRRDPTLLDRVAATVERVLPAACRVIAAPERKVVFKPQDSPDDLRINPYEVRSFSLTSLTKRLRAAGLGAAFCDRVTSAGTAHYEAAWAEYEDLHGEQHPHRFFRETASR